MRKTILAATAILMFFLAACDKKEQNSGYSKHESEVFSLEYPTSWDTVLYIRPFQPFMASSPSEEQVLVMATRLINGVSLDSFVTDRINAFQNVEDWQFELVEKKIEGNKASIHYTLQNEYTSEKFGQLMNIYVHGEHFYGIDCRYENDAQKDTVQHIMNSVIFNQ
jgi:hypothetical protein